MLLLTDRLDEGHRLQATLGQIQPCEVIALHQNLGHTVAHSIIICDVVVNNVAEMDLIRAALSHYRTTFHIPVLFLNRDPSLLASEQARALGATTILPYNAPVRQILTEIRRLIEPVAAPAPQEMGSGAEASVREAVSSLSGLFDSAKRKEPISAATLERGGRAVLAAIGQASIRGWLDVVRKYDDITYQHSLLVAGLAAAFGTKVGLTLNSQRLLSKAALIHDIGKAHVPREILNKTGKLTEAEMNVMRTHPVVGYDILVKQGGVDPRVLDVVRHHHEYLDGSGYPDGLRGNQISDFTRLATICDIYAALVERRAYKAPMPPKAALSILVDMGPKLDATLVKTFSNIIYQQ